MGAGSLLALMARHSLFPLRHSSKTAAEVHDIAFINVQEQKLHSLAHVNHAQIEQGQMPPPAGLLQVLSSFHIDLAERLQHLQLHGTANVHINWLLDALASTLSTHSSLQLALSAPPAATLAKHRADEVLSMLDVCTALKQVSDDMDHQFGCLQHALQSVGHALHSEKPPSSSRLRAAARRLSACLKQDRPHTNITGKQYRPLAEARASLLLAGKKELQQTAATPDLAATLCSQAIDGTMLTSLLVLASVVSSFAPPSTRKSSGTITSACRMIVKYLGGAKSVPNIQAWAGPLRQLHRDLRQEDASADGGALFQELKLLHLAATELHAAMTRPGVHPIDLANLVKPSVESLRKRLREAQACVSEIRMQIASLFQALVALRLALLDS